VIAGPEFVWFSSEVSERSRYAAKTVALGLQG
jgi:hypothetical protein